MNTLVVPINTTNNGRKTSSTSSTATTNNLSTSASTATLTGKKPTQQGKISFKLVLMSLAAGTAGNFQFGYLASVLTQPYVAIEQYMNTSWIERTGQPMERQVISLVMSALNVANPVAAIFGQMLALWVCNRFGRRKGAIIGCWVVFPGVLLSMAAKYLHPYFELLFLGRLIWSLAVGGLVVDQTIWLVEAAPIKFRGSVSSMQEVFAALGGLATQAFGVPFSTEETWHLMFVFPFIINIFCIVVFYCVPESPPFLLFQKKSPEKAKKAIAAYHGLTDPDTIEEQFQICSQSGVSNAVSDGKPKVNGMDIMFRPWKTKDPVSRVIRRGAWVGIMVKLAYLFTGARCIRSFNTYVLHDLGKWSYLDARWGSLIIGLVRIPATFLPVLIIDSIGRRPLLLSSTGASLLFLILTMFSIFEGESLKVGTIIGVGGLLTVTSVGLGSLARFYAAELVPRKLLLKSVSVLAILEALMRIVLEFSFYPLAHSIEGYYLLVFILPTIAFFVFMYFYCPETKGREINDVLNEMAIRKGVKVEFQITGSSSTPSTIVDALSMDNQSRKSSKDSNEENQNPSDTESSVVA